MVSVALVAKETMKQAALGLALVQRKMDVLAAITDENELIFF
jgi:hypothetical protein